MRMRGKSRTILILLVLATAILSQSLITPSASLEYPAVYIDPDTIGPNGYGINTTFNISICTNYTGADIWGWRFTLTYNPLVLNGTGVVNGNLTTNATHPAVFSGGDFNNYAGELSATEGYFAVKGGEPVNVTSGPGVLANVTFKVVGTGDTPIILGPETALINGDGDNIVDALLMPGNIGHSYFRNVATPTHDIAVISVEPNLTTLLAPTSVSINVTVKNNGTADERFAVEVYYEKIHAEYLIGSVMEDNLTADTSRPYILTWDTTHVEQGNHTIVAKVDPVMLETDTDDNQNEEAWVNVYNPSIAVVPESEIDPSWGVGDFYNVSIYTDYNATEVVGSNDVWGYNLTLTYNASVLKGIDVANGGNMPQTENFGTGDNATTTFQLSKTPVISEEVYVLGQLLPGTGAGEIAITNEWIGDGVTTIYNTSATPIVTDSEEIYYNTTHVSGFLTKDVNYTINYDTGKITFAFTPELDTRIYVYYDFAIDYTINSNTGLITFTPAPPWDVPVEVQYWYEMDLMPGATFTKGSFNNAIGELSLTSGSGVNVSGPGVLATVTFNITAIGESDIVLGNETVLIGYGSEYYNITMPHRLKKGYFTNMGDAGMVKIELSPKVTPPRITVYPDWTFNLTVVVQNVLGAPNFTLKVYYTIGAEDFIIATESIVGLMPDGNTTTLALSVSMSSAPPGEHILGAKVTVPTGDHNELNDYDQDGTVNVKLPGDVNGDGYVGPYDHWVFDGALGSNLGDPYYDLQCDFNADGSVAPWDHWKFAGNYGKSY